MSRTLRITFLLLLLSCGVFAAPHRLSVTPGDGVEERAFGLAAELGGELVGLDTKTGAVIVEITEESVARVANRGVRAIPCRTRDCFSTAAVAALVTTSTWDSGLYRYDGAGNIAAIGAERYAYDGASRLKSGTLERAGAGREQAYTYDAYGNITSITTLNDADRAARTIDASPASNRIATVNGTAWSYDARGNVTSDGALGFTWDALNVMTSMRANSFTTSYVYTADDERIAVIGPTGATSWTVRGLNQKVLREYDESAADATTGERSWTWTKDYLYRGELLAAAFAPTEGMHAFHLDHLGTPRLITDAEGYKVGLHDYYPFGEEASDRLQNEHALKFTGHERDYVTAGNQETRSLDYMHARYYSPVLGRFLSVDPVINMRRVMVKPQGWNRYAYVSNNPINAVDPDGRDEYNMAHRMLQITDDPDRDMHQLKVGLTATAIGVGIVLAPEAAAVGFNYVLRNPGILLAAVGMLGPPGPGGMGMEAGRTTLKEAKQLVGAWGKGTFDTLKGTLNYHFKEHGAEVGAKNMLQYMRKAYEFGRNLKGASPTLLSNGATRYEKNGKYIIKDVQGRILSFGTVKD